MPTIFFLHLGKFQPAKVGIFQPAETGEYSTDVDSGLTLLEFCSWLERHLDTPVIPNSTLPSGTWDFDVHWRTGDQGSRLAAVKDQVGPDLVEGTASVEYLVVDHVDRPLGRP